MSRLPLDGRVAVVSGANHGIGAATAAELARLGADVAVTYLAFTPADHDPGRSADYITQRKLGAEATVAAVEASGRRAHAVEADLAAAGTPADVFAQAEAALGPVSILVNNASGWRKDTFSPHRNDPLGRHHDPLSGDTALPQLLVDARGGALMIAQLAASVRRHDLGGGRIVSWITEQVRAFVATSTDHVHVAEPADVAEVIGWLCTDSARLVTGNIIRLR